MDGTIESVSEQGWVDEEQLRVYRAETGGYGTLRVYQSRNW